MEYKVTGCIDCPLYDVTGTEYGMYCHHPNRSRLIGHYDNGEFYEHELSLEEREKIITAYDSDDKAWIENEGEDIWVENAEIENDYNYDPITPDWCPLNSESITITKQ